MANAYTLNDQLEQAELVKIKEYYAQAMKQAVANQKAFLQLYDDVMTGKKKPPQEYVKNGKVKEWQEGFLKEALRKQKVAESIAKDLTEVGGKHIPKVIQDTMVDMYANTHNYITNIISHSAGSIGMSFVQYNRHQIGVLAQKAQSPFSKIAYHNLGKDVVTRRKLQREMAVAIINGESQEKMLKRIGGITGQCYYQAKRVAQTERTRIQAEATRWSCQEAVNMGLRIGNKWSARLVNTRDTHEALNGAYAYEGEPFEYNHDGGTVPNILRFPGDPSAPASEVCNCHCVLIPVVLMDDEDIIEGKLVKGITDQTHKANLQEIQADPKEQEIAEKQAKIADLESQIYAFDNKTYTGIWKDPVQVSDYPSKQASIQAKKDYFNNKMLTETNPDKIEEFIQYLDDLDEFEKLGKEYEKLKSDLKQAKKELNALTSDPDDKYSQERKDNALWTTDKKKVDDAMRKRTSEVWRKATREEKDAIVEYTQSYHKFNEPLRGQQYGTGTFIGVGKVDLNASYANNGNNLNKMTDLIEKCSYDHDQWFQRGCGYVGMDRFFNCTQDLLQKGTEKELQNRLLGTNVTEYAFMSMGSAKGNGFTGRPIMMNIYAPAGTKMMYAEPFSHYGNGDIDWDGKTTQSSFGSEFETILQQGTQFVITKVERKNGTIFIDLDVVNQDTQQRWKP